MYTYLLKLVSGNARGKPSQEAFLRSKNLCFLSFNEFEKSFRDRVLPMAVTREKSQGKKTLKDTQRTSRKRRRKKEEGYTGKCFLYIFPLFYPFLRSYNNETTSTTTTMRTTTSTTPIIWRKRASLEEKHLALLYSSSSSSSSSFLSFFLRPQSLGKSILPSTIPCSFVSFSILAPLALTRRTAIYTSFPFLAISLHPTMAMAPSSTTY